MCKFGQQELDHATMAEELKFAIFLFATGI